MLGDIGIQNFYEKQIESGDYKLKESVDDFMVYEVNADGVCAYGPLMNLQRYYSSKSAYDDIPDSAPKEERKPIHDSIKYYPFRRLKTVNNHFVVEKTQNDIFLCTLMKYNVNTTDATHILAKRLGIPSKNIQFGGNKDKRGVTFQEISIDCSFSVLFNYALSLSRNKNYHEARYGYDTGFDSANALLVQELSNHMEIEQSEVHDRLMLFNIRKGSAKRMGDNIGNRFRIKIRGLKGIQKPPKYFLNYFGHQRFGKDFNNHIVGGLILEQKFDDALDLIMAGCVSNNSNLASVCSMSAEKSPISGPDEATCHTSVQKYIAKMRQKRANSKFIVYSLDRLTRMMYMHAFQSYIFNCDVNRRWKDKGAFPGDCILEEGCFVKCSEDSGLEDIYIPLEQKADKFLKGGYRKMVEEIKDFSYYLEEDDVVVEFFLNKSCYATCALREIIGDSVCNNEL